MNDMRIPISIMKKKKSYATKKTRSCLKENCHKGKERGLGFSDEQSDTACMRIYFSMLLQHTPDSQEGVSDLIS